MRETEALHRQFLQFEEEFDLFNKRVAGLLFWERIRTRIYFQLYFKRLEAKTDLIPTYSKPHRLKFYLSSLFNLVRNTFLTSRKDLLVVGHPRRLLGADKRWWDIYTDTFLDHLDMTYVAIEENHNTEHRSPARTSYLHYFDFLDVIALLRSFLGFTKISLTSNERSMLLELQEVLFDRFEISINLVYFVTITLKIRAAKLPLYTKLLKRIKPKLVLLVNSFGKETLIEACKLLKIPTAELQHGIINNFHPTYAFSNQQRKYTFPDYMLVWGDYWKDNIDFPISQNNIISVGFPFIERELAKYRNVSKKQQILFISQGYVGNNIAKLALDLSHEIGSTHTIVYKLHPAECDNWKEIYPFLVDSEVDVIDRKDALLHKLFAESIAQVGIGSTALFEGLAHGLDTYILDTAGAEYFEDLAQKGLVQMISSAEDFLKHFNTRKEDAPADTELLFKINSTKNIRRFIHEIKDNNP